MTSSSTFSAFQTDPGIINLGTLRPELETLQRNCSHVYLDKNIHFNDHLSHLANLLFFFESLKNEHFIYALSSN